MIFKMPSVYIMYVTICKYSKNMLCETVDNCSLPCNLDQVLHINMYKTTLYSISHFSSKDCFTSFHMQTKTTLPSLICNLNSAKYGSVMYSNQYE